MVSDPISNHLYLLTGDSDGSSAPFIGIYKSTDHGVSWEILDGPDVFFAKKLMTNPAHDEISFMLADRKLLIVNGNNLEWNEIEELNNVSDFEYLEGEEDKLFVIANDSIEFQHPNPDSSSLNNLRILSLCANEDLSQIWINTAVNNIFELFYANGHGATSLEFSEVLPLSLIHI